MILLILDKYNNYYFSLSQLKLKSLRIMFKLRLALTKNLCSRWMGTERAINRVQILGRVGCDPRITVQDGQKHLAFFDVVTEEVFNKTLEDGSVEQQRRPPLWHSFMVIRPNLAEYISRYLVKGSRVLCNGTLQNRMIEGQDGTKRRSSNIILNDIIIVDDYKLRKPRYEDTVEKPTIETDEQ